jgi:hypothetical protein
MHYMQKFIDSSPVTPQLRTLAPYIAELRRVFRRHITPTWTRNTTHRLFMKVLPAVLEAIGDYPPKHLR